MIDFGVLETHDRTLEKLKNLGPAMDDIAGELLAISDEAFINLADPTTRALEKYRRGRIRNPGMGGLVQQPALIGTDRRHSTCRVRAGVL